MEAMLNLLWLLGTAGSATLMLYGAYLCCAYRLAADSPRVGRSMASPPSGFMGKAT